MLKQVTDVMDFTGDALNQDVIDYALIAILVVVGIWFIVELGCLRGTVGPNQYGLDPLGETMPAAPAQ